LGSNRGRQEAATNHNFWGNGTNDPLYETGAVWY